jgi:hypothetical protein
MKPPVLVALCLVAAVSSCAVDESSRDTAGVKTASLLEGFESRPELKVWLEFWKTQVSGLSLDSFALAHSEDFITVVTRDYNHPPSPSFPSLSRRAATLFFSPDSLLALDPTPIDLVLQGDSLVIYHEPDTFMNLIDIRTGIGVRVIQCGTPCHFDRIAWLDNHRVAVVGMFETGGRGEYLSPGIYLVDSRSRTLNVFFGPRIEGAQREACRVAWQEWQKQHGAER